MTKITCPCGAATYTKDVSITKQVMLETDWQPYLSTEICMTVVWICSACHTKVVEAAKAIKAVFGEKAKHIYYNNLFREPPTH